MPVPPKDRPLQSLREHAIDQLVLNYGRGNLSLSAFETRLDAALEAHSHDALLELLDGLDVLEDAKFAEQRRREFGIRLPLDREDGGAVDRMIHIFGGANRRGPWSVAPRIEMFNILGGVTLDFSDARLTSSTVKIRVFTLFGGADIIVPEHFNVVTKALCIFGGIDDAVGSASMSSAPTVIIEGVLIFGGIHVRVRTKLRERMLAFAQTVRDMFRSAH
jgi:hypothetical protein